MLKLRNIILAIILIISFILLGLFTVPVSAAQDWPLKIWKQNENGKMETFCLVDSDTGVNYVVVSGEMYGETVGLCITPRLNADGSLFVS